MDMPYTVNAFFLNCYKYKSLKVYFFNLIFTFEGEWFFACFKTMIQIVIFKYWNSVVAKNKRYNKLIILIKPYNYNSNVTYFITIPRASFQ